MVYNFIWWFLFLFHLELKFEEQCFFIYQGFLSWTLKTHRTAGEGVNHFLFHSTTSTRSQTLIHLFETFNVRWLSHSFNCITCIYQTATRWDLPLYRITIWLIDDVMLIFVWHEKPVDTNSHRLSCLYYKRTTKPSALVTLIVSI